MVTVARSVDALFGDLEVGSLLERERELLLLERCVADAERASGGLLVIDGPAGIGKTSLLRAVTTLARGRGLTVLSAKDRFVER